MDSDLIWPLGALLILGAIHGINPAMGWLFAVGLGMQEKSRGAVWRALPPLALGHGLAIVVAIGLAALVGLVLSLSVLKWVVAGALLVFGVWKLVSNRHPRYGGMRVGAGQLTVWSFLMASAHGAGLMVLPFVLQGSDHLAPSVGEGSTLDHRLGMDGAVDPMAAEPASAASHGAHTALGAGLPQEQVWGLLATVVHTAGYLLVAGLLAVVVYEKLGLRLLRRAWINLDLIWALALIATALATPFL